MHISFRIPSKQPSIIRWKLAGGLLNPKGIQVHSYKPQGVIKAVKCLLFSFHRLCEQDDGWLAWWCLGCCDEESFGDAWRLLFLAFAFFAATRHVYCYWWNWVMADQCRFFPFIRARTISQKTLSAYFLLVSADNRVKDQVSISISLHVVAVKTYKRACCAKRKLSFIPQ